MSGACGLISALTCALVTVTTTVLHMSRLQALRECEYAQKTRTCTCYSDLIESQVDRVDKGLWILSKTIVFFFNTLLFQRVYDWFLTLYRIVVWFMVLCILVLEPYLVYQLLGY